MSALETRTRLAGFEPDAARPLAAGVMHWCVVTPDLEATVKDLRTAYGIPGFLVIEPAPLWDVKLRGKPVDLRVDMALGAAGDVFVEVIRPHEAGGDSIFREFLAERPAGGIQHTGYGVDDFEVAYADLEAKCGPAVMEGMSGEATRFAYFDTRSSSGLYTEILWFDEGSLAMSDAIRRGDRAALTA